MPKYLKIENCGEYRISRLYRRNRPEIDPKSLSLISINRFIIQFENNRNPFENNASYIHHNPLSEHYAHYTMQRVNL